MSKNSKVIVLVKKDDQLIFDKNTYLPVNVFPTKKAAWKGAIDDVHKSSPELRHIKADMCNYGIIELEITGEMVKDF